VESPIPSELNHRGLGRKPLQDFMEDPFFLRFVAAVTKLNEPGVPIAVISISEHAQSVVHDLYSSAVLQTVHSSRFCNPWNVIHVSASNGDFDSAVFLLHIRNRLLQMKWIERSLSRCMVKIHSSGGLAGSFTRFPVRIA
jgi:hypothetical protein